MKIHLITTPEVSKKLLENVYNELNILDDEMVFLLRGQMPKEDMDLLGEYLNNFGEFDQSEKELFTICNGFRLINKPLKDDYVIVFTSLRETYQWFGANSNRNILINTTNYENIDEKELIYALAYQVIEYIFKSHLNIFFTDKVSKNRNFFFHNKGIRCINEYSSDIFDVIEKLCNTTICETCLDNATKNGISNKKIKHFQKLIDSIRSNYLSYKKTKPSPLKKIQISETGKITIGETEISMEPLPKTLYIFFLKHLEGITLENLKKYTNELLNIYTKIRKSGDKKSVLLMVQPYHAKGGTTFPKNLNSLNTTLIGSLNKSIVDYYTVNKNNSSDKDKLIYKIRLSPDYLDLDPKF